MSEEQKLKISVTKKGKPGTPHTELTKLRMSLVQTGVPKPLCSRPGEKNGMYGRGGALHPNAKGVAIWLKNSTCPILFESNTGAAAFLGVPVKNISNWATGKYKPLNGCVCVYLDWN